MCRENPSPIRSRGHTIVPSPARAEGTKGESRAFWRNEPNEPYLGRPRESGTHNHGLWLWVPALAALGRDDDFHKNGEPTCGCGNRSLVRLACSGLLFTGNAATPTCRAVSARSGRRPARARRDGRALTPRRARAARRARRDGPRSPLESRNRARPAEGCREFRPPCSRW